MRIRSVKPEYWQDEDLPQVSRDTRLLYIGLWNIADEHGRLRGDPRFIKGQLFPYDDDLTAADVDDMLEALAAIGKVVRYRAGVGQFLWLPKLDKHQRLEPHKVPSRLPAPPGVDGPIPLDSDESEPGADESESRADKSARGAHKSARGSDGNGHPAPDLGKQAAQIRADKSARGADKSSLFYGTGSMEHGACSREQGSRARRAPAHPLPETFVITDDMKVWAATTRPTIDVDHETQRFVDYYRAEHALRDDWPACWRAWIERAHEPTPRRAPARAGTNGHQPYRDKPNADYHGAL